METPSGTVTPDVIEENLPLSQQEIRDLRQELASMRDSLATANSRGRVSKSHSRRRRHRHYISDSSSDSEEGDWPRVSFVHANGTKPFLSLHKRFHAVNIKYFKQIFFGTFKSDHLTKLSHGYTTRAVNEDPQEASGMVHLLRCLEVYSQAIAFFAHPAVESSLHRALSDYRIHLSELSVNYMVLVNAPVM